VPVAERLVAVSITVAGSHCRGLQGPTVGVCLGFPPCRIFPVRLDYHALTVYPYGNECQILPVLRYDFVHPFLNGFAAKDNQRRM
jgi:hypothetical protein